MQVGRESVYWRTEAKQTDEASVVVSTRFLGSQVTEETVKDDSEQDSLDVSPAPSGRKLRLYDVAHSRAGDKGNDLNFSIVPHCRSDLPRLMSVITPEWVKMVMSPLLNETTFLGVEAVTKRDKWVEDNVRVEVYEVEGIRSLNVVVRNILDGGVNCSRRIDRHGKTISDLVLCQQVVLPP